MVGEGGLWSSVDLVLGDQTVLGGPMYIWKSLAVPPTATVTNPEDSRDVYPGGTAITAGTTLPANTVLPGGMVVPGDVCFPGGTRFGDLWLPHGVVFTKGTVVPKSSLASPGLTIPGQTEPEPEEGAEKE
ncbi:hypothetical protein GGR52DRAFT_573266 [Hypoxylon sp. FL1284]|nr:hypothetical protein GGR52DRAFT_573266 [Hypoxylon sp. FL1284]